MSRSPISLLIVAIFILYAGTGRIEGGIIDVSAVFANIGLEDGNFGGWKLTEPNDSYVGGLSLNPSIDPADSSNNPTVITAPAGSYFTGLENKGDLDAKYKIAHDPVRLSVPSGTVFQVGVFANRGRIEPYDQPPSDSMVKVRIFGWTSDGVAPAVNSSDDWSRTVNWNPGVQAFDFTGVADGSWAYQVFTFDPSLSGIDASALDYLSISITGMNINHDRYIATDVGSPIPEPATLVLLGFGLAALAAGRLRRRAPARSA